MKRSYWAEKNPRWQGGRYIDNAGYVLVKSYSHPCRDKNNYYPEHRLVMEAHLGRTLLRTEIVHHINENRSDNRIENLMLFPNRGAHSRHHFKGKPGRPNSKATRAKISKANKEKKRTEETKKRISEGLKGINTWTKGRISPMKGKRLSAAHKLKIKEGLKRHYGQ